MVARIFSTNASREGWLKLRMSSSASARAADRVDAGAALDDAEIERALRILRGFEVVNHRDCAGETVNGRTHDAEFMQAVSAHAFKDDAEALAADRAAKNAVDIGRIDCDHAVIIVLFLKERFAAAKIAVAFFAERSDKNDVADRLDVVLSHAAHDLKHAGKTARIIRDAGRIVDVSFFTDGAVGAFFKDGVDVRADDKHRAVSGTLDAADNIADRILMRVFYAVLLEHFYQGVSADFFVEGRCGDFCQLDLIVDTLLMLLFTLLNRFGDNRIARKAAMTAFVLSVHTGFGSVIKFSFAGYSC